MMMKVISPHHFGGADMFLLVVIEVGAKLTEVSLKIRISIFIWKKFVERPTGPKCRMAGITLQHILLYELFSYLFI